MSKRLGVGEYRTREGSTAFVRFVLSEPAGSPYVLVGEFLDECGEWSPGLWLEDGRYFSNGGECEYDLLPPPVTITAWAVVNRAGDVVCSSINVSAAHEQAAVCGGTVVKLTGEFTVQ